MEQPLISVIVPIYNVEEYLPQCIESIIGQDYQNIEVFLVNDGSTDSSGKICDEYAKKDSRITVIHQENQKASKARNAGLDKSSGEYISFIDGDDTVEPNIYTQCIDFIKKNNLDVVVFNCNIYREDKKETVTMIYPNGTVKSGAEMRDISLLDLLGGQVCFKLYSKECFKNVRFPAGRIYSDLAISHLTYDRIDRVGFLDQCLYNYFIRSTGTSLSPKPYKNYHVFLAFQEKYEYAKKKVPDMESRCLSKAAETALAVHSDYAKYQWNGTDMYLTETEAFLGEHKKEILRNKKIRLSKKMAIGLLLANKQVYYALYKIIKR